MDLSKKTKKQLIALCEEHELETDGTKSELLDLLTAHMDEHHSEVDPEPVVEEVVEESPAAPAADEMPKASARERVRIAWRLTQGGGHPPAMLWEEMTTDLALGRKSEADIKAHFAEL